MDSPENLPSNLNPAIRRLIPDPERPLDLKLQLVLPSFAGYVRYRPSKVRASTIPEEIEVFVLVEEERRVRRGVRERVRKAGRRMWIGRRTRVSSDENVAGSA